MHDKTQMFRTEYPLPNAELPVANILLVNDDATILNVIAQYLEDSGYRVAVAESGEEAFETMNESTFDLLITDLFIGDIDGFQVLKKAKELHLDIMVIILTGYGGINFAIDGLRFGADDYLLKPCDPDEMQFRVVRCLEKLEIKRKIGRSKAALRESEERLRSIIDNSATVISLKDMQGKYILVNKYFRTLFQITEEQIIGKTDYDIFSEGTADIMRKNDQKVITADSTIEFEEIFHHDHALHTFFFVKFPVYTRSGVPYGVCSIATDITERKKAETQLQQAQRMEAIISLAGGVAHDYNNLLMTIQGHASMMIMDKDSSHPDFGHLKGIEDSVERAADITNQLLGFTRAGKHEIKTTDLNRLIKKDCQIIGRTKKEILIHGEYEEKLWSVEIDRKQISEVLFNININSCQAMPEGGNLYLLTKNVTLDEDYVKPFEVSPGRYVSISVADTGIGMDQATKQKVFDPFFSTAKMGNGTGLGSTFAYSIVKNHGGFITVHSEKGEGSKFNIHLPAAQTKILEQKEKSKTKNEMARGSEVVLLVDDEPIIIDVGSQMLKSLGYEVLTAETGKKAIAICDENRDKIQMVILDMIMPGMDGEQTYYKIKEINPDVKVLLASGCSPAEGKIERVLDRGCNGFIRKPYKMNEFSQKLREILDI